MDILDMKSEAVLSFFSGMEELLDCIGEALKNRTPHLNGEKFLTGKEVCRMLHISTRTLQEWRSKQTIPFIRLRGKILYRQGDVEKILAEHCVPVR
jgi:excisionase family DNA binding protein